MGLPNRHSSPDAYVGRWVQVRCSGLGFAFCREKRPEGAVVVYTDIPGSAEVREIAAVEDLIFPRVSPGSRVWVKGEPYGWHAAEVTGLTAFGDYRVRVSGIHSDLKLSGDQFKIRWDRPLKDPVSAVAQGFCDSPEYYEARRDFLDQLVLQRRVSRGYTAFLSAPVELYQHQLDTAARVLSDPVLRYLLADEVGLGKTVEACVVVRQLLLDDNQATALIAVPSTLRQQWGVELRERFLLGEEMGEQRVRLVSHQDLADEIRLSEHAIVVVDEAHRLVSQFSLHPRLRTDLHQAKSLLLLSATPMSGNLSVLLNLLNLVDPVAYPTNDLESFRERVQEREREATNLQVLTSRRASPRMRSAALDELLRTHGKDPTVARLVEQCHSAEPMSAAWVDLSDYVRETYRISRRMIRHRRNSGVAEDYPVVGRRPIFVALEDPTRRMVDDFLEQYRDHLASNHTLAGSSKRFARMVLHGLGGPRALLHYLRRSLTVEQDDRALNEAMVARLQMVDTGTRARVALDVVADRLAKDLKIVVVGTSFDIAREFYEAAQERWGNNVTGHLASMEQAVREREILAFLNNSGGRVLVGDSTLEEGRNLQAAHVLINLDLPLDPNRLEQRIGRLDRFALRGEPAEIVTFVEPDSEWVSGHVRLLHEGIGIFTASVATLQRKLTEILNEIIAQVVREGSGVFSCDLTELQRGIEDERIEVDLLEELESVTAASDFDDATMADLRRSEGDIEDLKNAFLRFTSARGGVGLRPQVAPDGELLRFRTDSRFVPGLPDDLAAEVLPLLRRPRVYARSAATCRRGVAPLRLGDPLVDWLERYLRTDERGRARAIIRPCDDVHEPSLWMSCDFLVEFDASHLVAEDEVVRRRLRRRGDALFPPSVIRTWTNPNGPASGPVLEMLDAPFDPDSDQVLRGRAWGDVLTALPDWQQLCRLSADAAIDHIRSLPALSTEPPASARRAQEEVSARTAVLRARSQRLPTEAERRAALLEMEREESLGAALVRGTAQPDVSTIACGAIVLWPTP
ncbi:protein DpdE [Actinomadura sp. WMMA1423]|uniref:protein DpdE n=1 Tax=Actinomadura sp. WMMA1423 TaxID=2591108 RepID=UPI0011471777|nr:protein DpdE [Actinomadura sp. WMMA1423]